MDKKKKSGFFGKLFGGNKTNSCCAVEFEEIPETGSNRKEDTSVKESEKNAKTNTGCGCGC
jgi:hypothetical protein